MELTNEQYLILLGQKEAQIFKLQIMFQESQKKIQELTDKNIQGENASLHKPRL